MQAWADQKGSVERGLLLVAPLKRRAGVSAGMIAQELGIPGAPQDLAAELGLREVTGRGRYRAWRIA